MILGPRSATICSKIRHSGSQPLRGDATPSPTKDRLGHPQIGTNELEVLDLSIRDGKVSCAVERYKLGEQSRLVLSWNDTSASEGFQPIGNGVAFVRFPEPIAAKPRFAVPDDLGGGRLAWRDTAHEGSLIVIVVLPEDYVLRSVSETKPTPIRFKIFSGRMAFYWDIGPQMTELTWAIAKRGNRNLEKLVGDLNRQVIAAEPIEHALVVDHAQTVPLAGSHVPQRPYHTANWERITVAVIAVVVVAAILFTALRNDEIPARNFTLLRILLSGAMGFVGGWLPGFLGVDLSWKGTAIRAGGGLAFAIVTYFFTPAVAPNDLSREERQNLRSESEPAQASTGASLPPPPPPRGFPSPEIAGVIPLTEKQRASKDFAASKLRIQNNTNKTVIIAFTYRPYGSDTNPPDYKDRLTPEILGGVTIDWGQDNFGGPVHVSVFTRNEGWKSTNEWVDLGVVSDRKVVLTEEEGVFKCRVDQVTA